MGYYKNIKHLYKNDINSICENVTTDFGVDLYNFDCEEYMVRLRSIFGFVYKR